MLAYSLRRILLMIPTLFAIMVVNFVIVQAAPGGPVEQMIAKLKGNTVGATERGQRRRRRDQSPATSANDSRYRGARGLDPEFIKRAREAVRLRQAAARALPADDEELSDLRFRHQLLPATSRVINLIARQTAGVDLARAVDDAADLSRLDPARHPQGGARRQPLRRLDERGHHRRLCHPELPVRHAADRAVRRRQLSLDGSRCAAYVSDNWVELRLAARASSIISGTSRCRSLRWSSAASRR